MTKTIIIIALLLALIYLYYYQNNSNAFKGVFLEADKLKLKQQELNRLNQEIEKLKKAKSRVEEEWETNFRQQEKLLDTEQLENSKLVKKIAELEEEIKQLKQNMPGSFPE